MKTISVENLEPNVKDAYPLLQDFKWKIFESCWDNKSSKVEKKTPKLTLTPTQTRTLGLGLSPGKTIGVQNLKPLIAKDVYRERLLGKNLLNLLGKNSSILEVTLS